ncbi:MAG: hypothetical protein BWY48_00536 [Parcubacteria group bacterium ADurb.Bin305]|nr:MAG: hypothetical protein BWY48_00536 [Parcubacteria group bacterium ADurb.Bin305]
MPEKPEMVIALGVSSTIISTPVSCSMAFILRPSRPIILPFISSLGKSTTVVVISAVKLEARRSMAVAIKFLDFSSICSLASSFNLLSRDITLSEASFSTLSSRSFLASSVLSPAIFSNFSSSSSSSWLIFSLVASTALILS